MGKRDLINEHALNREPLPLIMRFFKMLTSDKFGALLLNVWMVVVFQTHAFFFFFLRPGGKRYLSIVMTSSLYIMQVQGCLVRVTIEQAIEGRCH